MKVVVIGAGAVGGLIAARLVAANAQNAIEPVALSVFARGATLAALQSHGLIVHEPVAGVSGEFSRRSFAVDAGDDPAAMGPQDLIIIALKYNAMAELAPRLAPLLGPDTVVMTAMNGVPWWFTFGLRAMDTGTDTDKDSVASLSLPSVDPQGVISGALAPQRVIGCVVHLAASTRGPGQIQLDLGNRLIIGEPSHQQTPRLARIAALLTGAGFDVPVSIDIHRDTWFKLWGNMTMNPVSALTGAKSDAILADPLLRGFMTAVMREAARVGARIGVPITDDPESRHAVTQALGGFRTSMLQDVEAGRELEIDALVTVVQEIAVQLGEEVPFTDALLGLIRVFAANRRP